MASQTLAVEPKVEEGLVRSRSKSSSKPKNYQQQQSNSNLQLCLNCSNVKEYNSFYCSRACGLEYVYKKMVSKKMEKLRKEKYSIYVARKNEIFEEILQDKTDKRSSLELMDLKALEEIEVEEKKLHSTRCKFEEQMEVHQKLISFLSQLGHQPRLENENVVKKRVQIEQLDCPNCGQPTPLHSFSFHAAMCNIKNDTLPITSPYPTPEDCSSIIYCDYYYKKDKTYCKRLKASCTLHSHLAEKQKKQDEICGCPLNWDEPLTGERCFSKKKNCVMHVNWESIAKAHLSLEQISVNRLEKALKSDKNLIKNRLVLRRMNSTV